ncbi:MAG: signal recognition particle-docking protein FtsY [Rickettsiales bacterium]|nr:signal recognition particle-docking protein FtsY [Rickettsiales bacterium]
MVVGWIKNLKKSLSKSSSVVGEGIKKILKSKKINDLTLEKLEDHLISSDIGISLSEEIIKEIKNKKFVDTSVEAIKKIIFNSIIKVLKPLEKEISIKKHNTTPFLILVVGVNGVGKTATVGKLAYKFSSQGKKVGIVAADTFRAAAVEQLEIWSKRTNSIFFSSDIENADPASLSYSSYLKAKEKNIDILIIDTAGRLHNKSNLMDQLLKIIRVLKKINENAPDEVILVLDGNTGQNSIKQASVFKEICDINSLIITKLDGTAKGGAVIPIGKTLKIPIVGLGVGEQKEDLVKFEADEFTRALLDIN